MQQCLNNLTAVWQAATATGSVVLWSTEQCGSGECSVVVVGAVQCGSGGYRAVW